MNEMKIPQASKRQMWYKISRSWWAATVAGCVIGVLLGWALQLISSLDGTKLSLVVGGVVGSVVATAMYIQRQRRAAFVLETVTVSVPHFTDMVFVVNNAYRVVAWKLFVETMTRISTQPLDPEGGYLREALNSLYQLFQSTRELLESMSPTQSSKGTTVELLAMRMLNVELRPFLTKWHPRIPVELKASASLDNSEESEFRSELEQLRVALIEYSKAFGELANVRQLDRFYQSED